MKTPAGHQTLELTGLRFDANLGILEHEKTDPQPIQVDAELNLGTQPLLPSDDDMGNSEVGHNALGAGRIFAQGAKLVNKAIETGAKSFTVS